MIKYLDYTSFLYIIVRTKDTHNKSHNDCICHTICTQITPYFITQQPVLDSYKQSLLNTQPRVVVAMAIAPATISTINRTTAATKVLIQLQPQLYNVIFLEKMDSYLSSFTSWAGWGKLRMKKLFYKPIKL